MLQTKEPCSTPNIPLLFVNALARNELSPGSPDKQFPKVSSKAQQQELIRNANDQT